MFSIFRKKPRASIHKANDKYLVSVGDAFISSDGKRFWSSIEYVLQYCLFDTEEEALAIARMLTPIKIKDLY